LTKKIIGVAGAPERASAGGVGAEYYERYWSKDGYNPRRTLPLPVAALLQRVMRPEMTCLDVGCGDGRTSGPWFSERTAGYVGVDVSQTAVETARSLGLDARIIEDASTLPFDDDEFDIVVCFEVLEHLNAPRDAAPRSGGCSGPGACWS